MGRCRFLVSAGLAALSVQLASPTPSVGQAVGQEHVGVYAQADIVRGAQLYAANCVVCHGLEGNSIAGVDLRRGQFRTTLSDEGLRRVVRAGAPTAGMPPFPGLGEAEQTALVAYIRAGFGAQAAAPAGPLGDSVRGRALVESDRAGCLTCHRIQGRGGRSAPDLSDVGAARPPASIAASLTDPSSVMLPINRPVRAVTRDGREIKGRRLNETTHTLLLSTDEGRLVALDKAALRSFTISNVSPMPSYRERLTAQERSDVVAYLLSLKDSTAAAAQGVAR